MAPPRRKHVEEGSWKKRYKVYKSVLKECCTPTFFKRIVFDPRLLWVLASVLFLVEVVVNVVVIKKVKYTEIDWIAYMQEVEGVVNGTWDYMQLKGDTGPLVYPAGFVYIFMALYYITSFGKNVRLAQYIFAVFYLINLALVFRLYHKSKKVPPYALIFLCCTSYRVHSIFVLRLFNDPVAMMLLYASLNLILDGYWSIGSVLYSLAVSVKMNILLFAPALLIAYYASQGIMGTIKQLTICALVQFILAFPFLCVNPVGYIVQSFNLGRVFLYEWTVNWRFLPEDIFVSRTFHLTLLALHVLVLLVFVPHWKTYLQSYSNLVAFQELKEKDEVEELKSLDMNIQSQLFLLPLFTSNFIGIVFCRSLHYQFYVWYFHTLPYLLWCTSLSTMTRIMILGVLEFCWNTYPSTVLSSIALHLCHLTVLIDLWRCHMAGMRGRKTS